MVDVKIPSVGESISEVTIGSWLKKDGDIVKMDETILSIESDKASYKIIDWNNNFEYLTASSVSNGFEEYKGFSWKVIVRQPLDDAFRIAEQNTSTILLISIFLGLIASIIGVFISNIISKPLTKLSKIVDDIANNKKVEFPQKASNDEIGKLQNAIKNLHKNLLIESNSKRNAELKVELSLKIFEQSLEGIIITDENNNIILINKAFSKITGYELNEVYGKNPSILASNLQNKEFYKNMWNEIKVNEKWSGYLKNIKKDGTIYEEYLKISSLKNENGDIINYLATFSSEF